MKRTFFLGIILFLGTAWSQVPDSLKTDLEVFELRDAREMLFLSLSNAHQATIHVENLLNQTRSNEEKREEEICSWIGFHFSSWVERSRRAYPEASLSIFDEYRKRLILRYLLAGRTIRPYCNLAFEEIDEDARRELEEEGEFSRVFFRDREALRERIKFLQELWLDFTV